MWIGFGLLLFIFNDNRHHALNRYTDLSLRRLFSSSCALIPSPPVEPISTGGMQFNAAISSEYFRHGVAVAIDEGERKAVVTVLMMLLIENRKRGSTASSEREDCWCWYPTRTAQLVVPMKLSSRPMHALQNNDDIYQSSTIRLLSTASEVVVWMVLLFLSWRHGFGGPLMTSQSVPLLAHSSPTEHYCTDVQTQQRSKVGEDIVRSTKQQEHLSCCLFRNKPQELQSPNPSCR